MLDSVAEGFGQRLCDCRKAMHMLQAQFGALLSCSHGAYSLYERGKRQPSLEMLSCLCSKLGVSLDYMLGCASQLPQDFAERLNAVSAARGKNLDDLFAQLGLAQGAAEIYKAGKGLPSNELLILICEHLNCSADYLLGRSGSPGGKAVVSIPPVRIHTSLLDDLTDSYRAQAESYIGFLRQQQDAERRASTQDA